MTNNNAFKFIYIAFETYVLLQCLPGAFYSYLSHPKHTGAEFWPLRKVLATGISHCPPAVCRFTFLGLKMNLWALLFTNQHEKNIKNTGAKKSMLRPCVSIELSDATAWKTN